MYKYFYYHLVLFVLFFTLVRLDETDEEEETESKSNSYKDQDIYNSKELFTHEPNITDINEFIQVKMYCEVGQEHCKKVQDSLVSAVTRLSKVIFLKNQIVIKASYYSFCLNSCSNSTFGWGAPSSQFSLVSSQEADPNFMYPQALAKQLLYSLKKNYDYDVVIDINHDIHLNDEGFWFNSSNTAINENQVDIEYVILHQLMHGIGLASTWAPYYSDIASPFQKLLNGLIPMDNLKIVTPNPRWAIPLDTGPAYLVGFLPSAIFDKFLTLYIPTKNITVDLMEYGFDMQGFCILDPQHSFIFNFMNSFLNNATQSSRAKSLYVTMATPNTLVFNYLHSIENPSAFYTDPYLNSTYKSIELMTGPDILSSSNEESYYRPGISASHLDEKYYHTPDFLMVHEFIRGKPLDLLVEEGYSDIPIIHYNLTQLVNVNITTMIDNTTSINTTITRNETIEYVYKSAIGPGILRILETIGYSTVLTKTNYTNVLLRTNKPDTPCDQIDNNSLKILTDRSSPLSTTSIATIEKVNIFLLLSFIFLLYLL